MDTTFEKFASLENLYRAFRGAKRSKGIKPEVLEFENHLEENLLKLRVDLLSGTYKHSLYRSFVVMEPKLREIKAAPFRDRVVHHAICRIIEPFFERGFIFDSYACRVGKGTHRAVRRLRRFLQSATHVQKEKANTPRRAEESVYCLQCDVSKYFASIDHRILLMLICKKVKDFRLFELIKRIIDSSYDQLIREDLFTERKTGLPIGNLTSQLFANIYLNELDRFVKHDLRLRYYIRYMDDFLFLHSDKKELNKIKQKVVGFLNNRLRLSLHSRKANIFPIKNGIDFLGYRIYYPKTIKLRKSTVWRFIKRFKKFRTDDGSLRSLQSWRGYAKHGQSFHLQKSLGVFTFLKKFNNAKND